jgi:hypothetical protein
MLITNGITDRIFRQYFSKNSGTVYFSIALLSTVFYRWNHLQIEKSSILFGEFLKKKFSKLNI